MFLEGRLGRPKVHLKTLHPNGGKGLMEMRGALHGSGLAYVRGRWGGWVVQGKEGMQQNASWWSPGHLEYSIGNLRDPRDPPANSG